MEGHGKVPKRHGMQNLKYIGLSGNFNSYKLLISLISLCCSSSSRCKGNKCIIFSQVATEAGNTVLTTVIGKINREEKTFGKETAKSLGKETLGKKNNFIFLFYSLCIFLELPLLYFCSFIYSMLSIFREFILFALYENQTGLRRRGKGAMAYRGGAWGSPPRTALPGGWQI